MVQVIVLVMASAVMSDPLVIAGVNVRSIGMPWAVAECPVFRRTVLCRVFRLRSPRRLVGGRRRPVLWDMPAAKFRTSSVFLLAASLFAIPTCLLSGRQQYQQSHEQQHC